MGTEFERGEVKAARGRVAWVRRPGVWAFGATALFLVVNLATLGGYGISADESPGMERGRQTIALLSDLIAGRPPNPMSSGLGSFHPTFYATCNYLVSQGLIRHAGFGRIAGWHFLNVLTSSTGLLILYYLGRCLFNETVGLAALGFLAFFPRFIAHAHYNGKDIPLMVFAELTLLCLSLAVERRGSRYWLLAGVAMGMSVTTKLDGLFLVPIFVLGWLYGTCSERKTEWKSDLRGIGLFLATAASCTFLFWPVLWEAPGHFLASINHFSGSFIHFRVDYLGKTYPVVRLPWHSLPMHLAAVTPLLSLVLVVVGAGHSLRQLVQRREMFEQVLVWSWLLVPVLTRMLPGVVEYNGMRHVFLVVPPLALLAGLAVDQWRRHWLVKRGWARSFHLLCGGASLWLGWQTVQVHPYEGSYLNEGVRLIIPGPRLWRYFYFDSYGAPLKAAVDWLNTNAPPYAIIAVPNYFLSFRCDPVRPDLQIRHGQVGDFIVLMVWRKDLIKRFAGPPRFAARCYGAELVSVYSRQADGR